jgi:hypothetical protein
MTTASSDPPSGLPMSSAASPVPAPEDAARGSVGTRVEALVESLSERLNPILVKEARQALKSKQFLVTFSLLLAGTWVYTLLFVMLTIPGVFYLPLGSALLTGYYLILAVPLLVVIPYASFRSLAAELEDGTYDLLSITTLSAWQIVTGKLGSSLLQKIVYYSALAPCIALTYLLGGVDVVTIGVMLVYTFAASLMLSIVAITVSTVTRARHWQVLLSVLLMIGLLGFGVVWCTGMLALVWDGDVVYDNSDFWLANLQILTFYVPSAILLLLIAAGQVTFASENRSTRVRVVLLVLQMLIVGWSAHNNLRTPEYVAYGLLTALLIGNSIVLALFWGVVGPFLVGEVGELSPRARRQLPQSLLGRMAFTWFNPGSGTGYVFAMANLMGGMATLAVVRVVAVIVAGDPAFAGLQSWNVSGWSVASLAVMIDDPIQIWFQVALVAYLALYLGLARLSGLGLRAVGFGGGQVSVVISFLVIGVMGIAGPLALEAGIHWFTGAGRIVDHTFLQSTNWVWTLDSIQDGGEATYNGTLTVLVCLSGIIFLINFLLASKEVEQVRLLTPARVQQDDLERHPPQSPARSGPWDEPTGAAAEESSPSGDPHESPTSSPQPGATL